MNRNIVTVLAVFGLVLGAMSGTVASADADQVVEGVIATFEGQKFDLSDGWGEAAACTSDGVTARCYRSEAEMDQAEGAFEGEPAEALVCSGSVRLYRGLSYGGGVLQLTTQYVLFNLASHGFDNDTSSYKIGPCAAIFYDTTTGSGVYPGDTSASVSKPSMYNSWDDRVGSVYIT